MSCDQQGPRVAQRRALIQRTIYRDFRELKNQTEWEGNPRE